MYFSIVSLFTLHRCRFWALFREKAFSPMFQMMFPGETFIKPMFYSIPLCVIRLNNIEREIFRRSIETFSSESCSLNKRRFAMQRDSKIIPS